MIRILSLLFLFAASAQAGERASHPFGIYAGLGGSDVDSLNVGFNFGDKWRLHGGDYVTTKGGFNNYNVYEAGLAYFTSNDGLSPFIGGEMEGIGLSSAHGHVSGIHSSLAAELGVDWTAQVGFNLGLRAVFPLSDLTDPWLNVYLGWYF